MEWFPAIIGAVGAVLVYALVGLFVAWLIMFVGKRKRLPRWPIYAGAALGLLSVAGAVFVTQSADDGTTNSN